MLTLTRVMVARNGLYILRSPHALKMDAKLLCRILYIGSRMCLQAPYRMSSAF